MSVQQAKEPDGAALLPAIEAFLTRYAVLPPGMSLVLALYAVMTHCFELFDALSYIAVTSPVKACGKTRVLELLSMVCARACSTVGITAPALFRTIEEQKPTLLVDESESLSGRTDKAEALREIANAGYKRGQKVRRCEGRKGGKWKVVEFDVFGPKVFALIGKLPATLADRSIEVRMHRTRKRLARYRRENVEPEGRSLHDQIRAWVALHGAEVKAWYLGHDLEALEGRSEELWLPLFAVCSAMALERVSELKRIALASVGASEAGGSGEISLRLLSDIRDVFDSSRQDKMFSTDVCKALNSEPEWPYSGWNQQFGIQPNDLARRLEPFSIGPHNVRIGERVNKGYQRQDFEPSWENYLPPSDRRYTATEGINTGQNDALATATPLPCSGTEKCENPNVYAGCSAVADSRRE